MTNYLTQDAPLSPPDTSRAEEEEVYFEKSLQLWMERMPSSSWSNYCEEFVTQEEWTRFKQHMREVYRPLYDKLHKEIEDDRYPL